MCFITISNVITTLRMWLFFSIYYLIMTINLKPGEVALVNESHSQVIRFHDLFDAAANAVNHHRSNFNGWKIVDDLSIEYPDSDWADLASYLQ